MDPKRYLRAATAETDLDELAEFQDRGLGRALRHLLLTRLGERRAEIESNPVLVTDGDVRPSIPFKLGAIEELNWLLDFLADARRARGLKPKDEETPEK